MCGSTNIGHTRVLEMLEHEVAPLAQDPWTDSRALMALHSSSRVESLHAELQEGVYTSCAPMQVLLTHPAQVTSERESLAILVQDVIRGAAAFPLGPKPRRQVVAHVRCHWL